MAQIMVVWQTGDFQQAKAINSGRPFTIGRHPGCDVVLGDPHVSRLHVTVLSENGDFVLHNHSRTNPVIYNRDLSLLENMSAPLRPGDSFVVGKVQLTAMATESSANHWKIRCLACGHTVDHSHKDCPWCALPLSDSKPLVKPVPSENGKSPAYSTL
jgi:pSer/pThr/pTyr-binding forkhead associated (FHA) protein